MPASIPLVSIIEPRYRYQSLQQHHAPRLTALSAALPLRRTRRSIMEDTPPLVPEPSATASSVFDSATASTLASSNLSARAVPAYQAAFALTYQKLFNSSMEQAQLALPLLDATLRHSWHNVSYANDIETSWLAQSQQDQALALLAGDIVHWLGDTALLPYTPNEHDGAINVGMLQYQARQAATYAGLGQHVYWQVLQRTSEWIDPQRVKPDGYVKLNILKALCFQRRMPPPIQHPLQTELGCDFNLLLDEAALIAWRVEHHTHLSPQTPYARIQAAYRLALLDDLQDHAIAQQLIPHAPIAPEYARFWYGDGVLHNAVGLTQSDLCDALFSHPYRAESAAMMARIASMPGILPAVENADFDTLRARATTVLAQAIMLRYRQRPDSIACDDRWLTRTELDHIVGKKMHDLVLDSHFVIGSPFHSIASVIERLAPAHDVILHTTNDPEQLIENFKLLNAAWYADPQFPAQPLLIAAFHWSLSNGMSLLKQSTGNTQPQRVAASLERHYADFLTKNGSEQTWLAAQHLALWPQLPAIAQLPNEDMPPLLGRIVAAYKSSCAAAETILYRDQQDLIDQLNARFSDSLSAYSPLPVFNQDSAIRALLKTRLALSDAEIDHPRNIRVFLNTHPIPNAHTFYISPLNEFKLRSILSGISLMKSHDLRIDAKQAILEIKPAFKAALFQNQIVRARVREILRLRGLPYTEADFNDLVSLQVLAIAGVEPVSLLESARIILENIVIGQGPLSLIVGKLSSGEPRQMLEILPFVIPLYDIEQGIQHHNRSQMLEGAINFGLDALMCWLGGVAEGAMRTQLRLDVSTIQAAALRLPVQEAANLAMLNTLSKQLPSLSQDILLTERRILIERDPFHVIRAPTPKPNSFPVLAARTRAGESISFTTPDNDHLRLLHLVEDDSVVAVRREENYLAECNLFGEQELDAAPIFETNTQPRRLSVGLPGGSAMISESQLLKRSTVNDVLEYWRSIGTDPAIINRKSNPSNLFHSLYKFADEFHALNHEFEEFVVSLYQRSPTMAAIFNHAKQLKNPHRTNIIFDTTRACSTNQAICFLSDAALSNTHYMTSTGPHHFTRKRMWLHELLHSLTHFPDFSATTLAAKERSHPDINRSIIIYFVERIRNEGMLDNHLQPARISYSKAFFDGRQGHAPMMAAEQIKHIGIASDWAVAENLFLDERINPLTSERDHHYTMGQSTADRVTVKQALALDAMLTQSDQGTQLPIQDMINTLLGDIVGLTKSGSHNALQQRVRQFALQSLRFRRTYAMWANKRIAKPLKIKFTPLARVNAHIQSHQIAYDRRTILINSKPIFYYSDHGAIAMSNARKVAGALLDMILPEAVQHITSTYPENLFRDRSLGVLIENQMMSLAGDLSPPRICKAVTSRADGFLKHQSSITRAANAEDWLLKQQLGTNRR